MDKVKLYGREICVTEIRVMDGIKLNEKDMSIIFE